MEAQGSDPTPLAVSVVQDIFSVSLTLASARSLVAGQASARLDQAIDDLDTLVRDLWSNDPSSEADPVVERAADALSQVDGLLVGLWADALANDAPPSTRERITHATGLVRATRTALTATAVS